MGRPLLFSCALHLALALIAAATTPRASTPEPPPSADALAPAAPVAPPAVVDIEVVAGGGGPPRPQLPAVVSPPRAVRLRPAPPRARTIATVAPEARSAPTEAAVEIPPPAESDGEAVPDALVVADAAGSGAGDGSGDGAGSGHGAGIGPGGGAMGRELHARVLGNEAVRVEARAGAPVISHDEATALRAWDAFPRLPEAVWPEWRPYVVKLEVCVGDDGLVTDAVLCSSASARLDPIVRAAVLTWRYRPRVVGGTPAPFCHGVVIKYERW